ncbi:MAG: hypothetical protein ACRBBW_20350 [Cellvibrionaceae bacterium]
MEPMTAIAIAKGLASVTGFDSWISEKLGDKLGDKTAQKIIDVAKIATGATTPEQALERAKADQQMAQAIRKKLVDNEHELALAALNDIDSARTMYSGNNTMADEIARRVITQNHWAVAILLACNGLVIEFVDDKTVALALGNLIGTSVAALWQERQQVIGFFFGSSMGSKLKDMFAKGAR